MTMEVVGEAVENLRRSNKYVEMRSRAEALYDAGAMFRTANREARWKRSEKQYEGKHWADQTGQDQITINMSFSTANLIPLDSTLVSKAALRTALSADSVERTSFLS